jgi:hypothetical protein
MKESNEMAARKSKSSGKQRPTDDSTYVEDNLEKYIQRVIKENRINLAEKLEPIFTAVRAQANNGYTNEDVSRKYEAFLQSIIQVMNNNNIITMDVGYFADSHSYNSPNFATIELNSRGLFAEHCDGPEKIENVMNVLSDLHEPEHILRTLIGLLVEKTNMNKCTIVELESCLELVENAIKNSNVISTEPDGSITSDKRSMTL